MSQTWIGDFLLAARTFEFRVLGVNFSFVAAVVVVGELEGDQPQHGRSVFTGFKIGVGAQLIGGTPQISFQLFELVFIHAFRLFYLSGSGDKTVGEIFQ